MSDYVKGAFSISLPCVGGLAGGYIARKNMNWFKTLNLPSWNPPDCVFAPVFGTLYCSMGFSSYVIYQIGGGFAGDSALPLAWYSGQLAFNWAWSPLLFGLKNPKLAFVDSVCLWGAVVGTIYNFYPLNPKCALILLPYLGWVTFASFLNFRIWRDNPTVKIEEITEKEDKKE